MARGPIPEFMEDTIAMGLEHLSVDVKARVPQLGDFFGKQFDAIDRVAENDGLVDFEFREESV